MVLLSGFNFSVQKFRSREFFSVVSVIKCLRKLFMDRVPSRVLYIVKNCCAVMTMSCCDNIAERSVVFYLFSVIQFCSTAFAYYAQATAAQEIFGHTFESLRGIKYLYK